MTAGNEDSHCQPVSAPQPPLALSGNQISLRKSCAILATLVGLALVLRLFMLDEFLRENPLAEMPRVDARTYWDMAERMADGQWVSDTPFLSAPLYPYLLGVIRTLGGGLLAVYIVQLVMHLATGVVVAWTTRIRFGELAGIVAAALFFSLTEPAISVTRVLANTLQLLLVALLWWRWATLSEHGSRWCDVLLAGALIGLFALAYPAAILLIPLYGLWLWWHGSWRAPALARALAGTVLAALIISPATLHNLILHGELIPITAHSGITLHQGNNPDARGNITALPGISMRREQMHVDAARQYQAIHGHAGTWREIDRYHRRLAFDWWLENPLAALRLFGDKFYYYLTVRNYDDIMSTAIEREAGLADRAILAPLATPWLFGFALVGLLAVLRRPIRYAPEWLLTLLPLLVVLVFFYSPRYRMPAVPLMCGLSAYAVTHCRRFRLPTLIVIIPFFLPLPLYVYNRATGIDSPEHVRGHFLRDLSEAQMQVGDRRLAAGEYAQAEARYRSALALWDDNVAAHDGLGTVYLRQGRLDDAIREYQEVVRLQPGNLPAQYRLYNAYCLPQNFRAAANTLRRVTRQAPQDAAARLTLAWLLATCPDDRVRNGEEALQHAQAAQRLIGGERCDVLDVLAAAHAELGHFDQAVSLAEEAVQQAQRQGQQQQASTIEQRAASYRAGKPCRAPPRPILKE
jgi:4-amino-4-deoxy-L-arabinose transferase-like glycosyltransferase